MTESRPNWQNDRLASAANRIRRLYDVNSPLPQRTFGVFLATFVGLSAVMGIANGISGASDAVPESLPVSAVDGSSDQRAEALSQNPGWAAVAGKYVLVSMELTEHGEVSARLAEQDIHIKDAYFELTADGTMVVDLTVFPNGSKAEGTFDLISTDLVETPSGNRVATLENGRIILSADDGQMTFELQR